MYIYRMQYYLNIIGLICDTLGVILLFLYGLLSDVSNKSGAILMEFQDSDKKEVEKYNIYKFRSRIGLMLIIIGFLCQLISNIIFMPKQTTNPTNCKHSNR